MNEETKSREILGNAIDNFIDEIVKASGQSKNKFNMFLFTTSLSFLASSLEELSNRDEVIDEIPKLLREIFEKIS